MTKHMRFLFLFPFLAFIFLQNSAKGQEFSTTKIQSLIQDFKEDTRGPFLDIKWFCDDGTMREARDPCPDEIGGNQHARYKDITKQLHDQKLYFARILTGSDKDNFWNWEEDYDPIKQYMVHKYLESIDDGWILQKAQYYRGSIQSEDEMEWAEDFFEWVLASDYRAANNYLLIRQAAKSIPHGKETETGNQVRVLSKVISDRDNRFLSLRTKIHGNPEPKDIQSVKEFREKYEKKLSEKNKEDINQLITEMETLFQPAKVANFDPLIRKIPTGNLRTQIENFRENFKDDGNPELRFSSACELLLSARENMLDTRGGKARLAVLDITILLEKMIKNDLYQLENKELGEITDKLCYLNQAVTGCGYIELWENNYTNQHAGVEGESVPEDKLQDMLDHHKRVIEWASLNFTTLFDQTVEKYISFEPLAHSFIDDQIRNSIMLQYGDNISQLSDFLALQSDQKNAVFSIKNQERIRGLNPGYALGKLAIVEFLGESHDEIESFVIDPTKIYIFLQPPADLSPVEGIMTVNEGNAVSHVQLLARNLGIPNAVLSENNLKSLKKYEGDEVFYAVSLSGTVIMKRADDMTKEEKKLFEKQERAENKVTVDTSKIDLKRDSLLDMRDLSGMDSGISCGPKAANLAQLKRIFPDKVVEGMVIPFGIYRNHMEQEMETRSMTYWEFINQIFIDKAYMLEQGWSQEEVECVVLGELEVLRDNIKKIPLDESLKSQLRKSFVSIFGKPIGQVPVFLRSDTNMEDLKDFTGAGLNLTKFNVLQEDVIYDGIKEVWASPFTERSYKWRQSYLNNPENVFPSILVIPSVNVDYSGVIITKDIQTGDPNSMTIAFSRGVGGAVDGQKAETTILTNGKVPKLLSPSRETKYRTIPPTGGSTVESAHFSEQILNYDNLNELHKMVQTVEKEIPKHTEMRGPYDIELGFKDDKIWLFQIRPFVENKQALSSDYLQSISYFNTENKSYKLNQKI